MGCHALLQGIFPTQGWNLYPLCLLDWQVGSLPLVSSAAAAKSLQSCPTLCDPIDGSPPGSPVPGILQARTLERVAISFSNAWKWKVKVKSLSRVRLLATPWTAAYQAPLSMGFSRQKYWSGVPLPSPLTIPKTDPDWLHCETKQNKTKHSIMLPKECHMQHESMLSCFSHVWLFVILWTIVSQAPLSMGFSRQEYWSGLPCPPLGHIL